MKRKNKKKSDWVSGLFLLAMFVIGIVGTFFSGLVIGRNYRSIVEGFLKRFGVLFLLIPCVGINALLFGLLSSVIEMPPGRYGPLYIYSEDLAAKQAYEEADEPSSVYKPIGIGGVPAPECLIELTGDGKIVTTKEVFFCAGSSLAFFLLGVVVGVIQRAGRRRRFAIEEENIRFLAANNLKANGRREFIDSLSGQIYRVENIDDAQITLFPKRTRGKRAYIYIDDQGRYTQFSGIIKLASKGAEVWLEDGAV